MEAIELMEKMLVFNSEQRMKADDCLKHEFFNDIPQSLKTMSSNINTNMSMN
jgi:serine/threonine protein kinase